MKDFMKRPSSTRGLPAFSLVELLIVISIIGILAAMIFPAFGAIKDKSARKKAKAELERIAIAIDAYKDKYGHYPPDNRTKTAAYAEALHPLFYELRGTRLDASGNTYELLDGGETIKNADVKTAFNLAVTGFINCSRGGGDDLAAGHKFLTTLTPSQYGFATNGGVRYGVLVTSIPWPAERGPLLPGASPELNPIRYNSSSPTNNAKSYDLWVDLVQKGRTNRVSNWNDDYTSP